MSPKNADRLGRLTELAELVRSALGHDLDEDTFKSLLVIQTHLRQSQSKLMTKFDDGEILAEEYFSRVNALLKSAMEANKKLLGEARFIAIFEDAGNHPEGLIDKDTFFATARRRPKFRQRHK